MILYEGKFSPVAEPQPQPPSPEPKRNTDKYHLRQEGITLEVRVNW